MYISIGKDGVARSLHRMQHSCGFEFVKDSGEDISKATVPCPVCGKPIGDAERIEWCPCECDEERRSTHVEE
jgi:hypothetical protein